MITDTLTTIRAWLMEYQPLTDHLTRTYGCPGRHFIGLVAPKAADHYPFFAYILANEEEEKQIEGRSQVVIIRWDIHQPGLDPQDRDVYLGPLEHAAIGELVREAVLAGNERTDPLFLRPGIRTLTDLYTRHPYYGGEMQLSIVYSAEFTEG